MTLNDVDLARKWADEAQLLQFTEAATVRTAAQTWTGYITAFLGVLGFAGVSFMPAAISKVTGSAHDLVLWLGVGVILLGLAALVLAALASGSVPVQIWNDGDAYKAHSKSAVSKGIQLLLWSRWLTFGAVTCLLLSAALATIDPGAPEPVSHALITQSDGKIICVEAVTDKTTGAVNLKDTVLNKAISTLSIVERCP